LIRKDSYIIWPAYFDAKNARSDGRRVPLKLAVQKPSADDLLNACRRLGWLAEKHEGSYPRKWYLKSGYVVVKPTTKLSKNSLIHRIAEELVRSGKK